MPIWTLIGLTKGVAATRWPQKGGDDGQPGVLGMPRVGPKPCQSGCSACVDVCPTQAIALGTDTEGHQRPAFDYGRCIACQLCVEACPEDVLETTHDWAFGVRERDDLRLPNAPGWDAALAAESAQSLQRCIEGQFKRSLHIRHVDAGSDNACESELQALNNPFYNLHRLGIFFTPSPRAADLLLVTGSITHAMREPLLATWNAMPEPRMVMACGTDAVSGGLAAGGYTSGHGLDGVLPVDLWLPGDPPNPAAIIQALLMLLERMPQRVHEGHIDE
ncbi:MAG: 4Fe-4S binding protein [Rhodanobacteraceae bacterium]